jgi:hypothetical protein
MDRGVRCRKCRQLLRRHRCGTCGLPLGSPHPAHLAHPQSRGVCPPSPPRWKIVLTPEQRALLGRLAALRGTELGPVIKEWREGNLTPDEERHYAIVKRRERRLLKAAVRAGLEYHPQVLEWFLTMCAFGRRDMLRGTGLEKGLRAPLMARADHKKKRLALDEAKLDAVLRLLDRGLTLHSAYQHLRRKGIVVTQPSGFYRWAKRRGVSSK